MAIYGGQGAFDLFVAELTLTAPITASILEQFSGIVAELEAHMGIALDIEYALENLHVFEEFFTLDYYIENDLLTTEIEKTEDFSVLTTVTLEPIAYAYLLQEVAETTVTYLEGFEAFELPSYQFINCESGEVCEPLPEYNDLMMNLGLLGEVEYTILYDPSTPTEVITELDLTEFINNLAMLDEEITEEPVIELSIKITVREGGTVTIPEDVSDINMIAEDVAKFSLVALVFDEFGNVLEYAEENPEEFALDFGERKYLGSVDSFFDVGLAFDKNMSYIEMGGSIISPEYYIQLFWHDGTQVFTSPIGIIELVEEVFEPLLEGPMSNEIFLELVDMVDEENFNMTKLLFVYIFNETDEYIEEPVAPPLPYNNTKKPLF